MDISNLQELFNKENPSDFIKSLVDSHFKNNIKLFEKHANEGEFNRVSPSLIVTGVKILEGGLEVCQQAFDFDEYKTPRQRATLREIARVFVGEQEMMPIGAFLLCEASSYSPTPEEMKEIEDSGFDPEVIDRVREKAISEGKKWDLVFIAGLSFKRNKYFYSHMVHHENDDDFGTLQLLTEQEYKENYNQQFERRVVLGIGDEDADPKKKKAAESVIGMGIDTLGQFYETCKPFLAKRFIDKSGVPDEAKEHLKKFLADEEAEVADKVNRKTNTQWESDEQ